MPYAHEAVHGGYFLRKNEAVHGGYVLPTFLALFFLITFLFKVKNHIKAETRGAVVMEIVVERRFLILGII